MLGTADCGPVSLYLLLPRVSQAARGSSVVQLTLSQDYCFRLLHCDIRRKPDRPGAAELFNQPGISNTGKMFSLCKINRPEKIASPEHFIVELS